MGIQPHGPTRATGFAIDGDTPEAVAAAIGRALEVFNAPPAWHALQRTGMDTDFSWRRLADSYIDLYRSMVDPVASVDWPAGAAIPASSATLPSGANDAHAASPPTPVRRGAKRA